MFREMGNKFWIITNNQNNSVTGDEFFNAFLKVGMRLVPVNYRMTDLFDTVTNHVQFRKSTFHSLRHCRCSVQENGCNMTHAVGRERKNVSRDVGPVTQSAAGHSRSRGPLKRVSLPGFRHSTLPQWLSYSSEPVNCETVIASSSRQLIGKKMSFKTVGSSLVALGVMIIVAQIASGVIIFAFPDCLNSGLNWEGAAFLQFDYPDRLCVGFWGGFIIILAGALAVGSA